MRLSDNIAESLATACQWLLIAAFAVFFSALSLTKHAAFQTHGFDLGNYDQTVWNTLHGHLLACTNWPSFGQSRLAFHVEPILLLITPLYLLHAGPETLLVLQAVVVGLGAWPVAQIGRRRLGNIWMGPLFAALYLLFPALEAGPTFEFHAVALVPTFLAMALYGIEMERYGASVLWLALAAACKEEISLLVAMIGVYLIVVRRRYKLGLALVLLSMAWFLLCTQVILPYFNVQGESAHLGRYSQLGGSVPDIVANMLGRPKLLWDVLRQPDRLAYLWRIPLPMGYLSLLAPEMLLLALPTVTINVLSTFPAMYTLDVVHYSVPVVPFVVIAAIYGCERLLNLSSRFLVHVDRRFVLGVLGGYMLFTSLFYHRMVGHTPLARPFRWPEVTEHHRICRELLQEIPDDAAVSAQRSLNPHVSQRRQVFVFPEFEQADIIVLDVSSARDNVFELTPNQLTSRGNGDTYSGDPSLTYTEYQRLVNSLLDGEAFGVVEGRDGYLILKRGSGRTEIPEAFYSAFLTADDGLGQPIRVAFGDARELVGLRLEAGPGTSYYLHTFWDGPPTTQSDLHLYLALLDRSIAPAEVIAVQELTASAFGSPLLWRDERQVHDRAFVFFPSPAERYALGLVVGTQEAPDDASERLPISVEKGTDMMVADEAARALLLDPGKGK
ncbi:MAG: DUF2079 domain-containing protein [Chloroflexota bacterium]|nr:DUF2079 domain-containing protein [Chloroflexota bacterium]